MSPAQPPIGSSGASSHARSRGGLLSFEARRALGPLLGLLDDTEIRDILMHTRHGLDELWIDDGRGVRRVEGWHPAPGDLRRLAVSLISAGGRQLDELHPCANVHLGEGIRVHAVLPPVSVAGPVVSIRVPRPVTPRFADLVAGGLCGEATAARLGAAIRERQNILITGSTGSGKTTLLAALLDLVPARERILTIEDVAEVRLRHPHHIALEARPPNTEGAGEFSVDALLREALRMRPDRIVLGECRGAEIATLLAALNTGHDGGAGTLHANRLSDVPARLEALGMLAGLSPRTLARQAVSAVHWVVHLERMTHAGPRVAEIGRFDLAGERLVVTT